MLINFCIIALVALFMNRLFERVKLPGLLGLLIVGVVLGPYGLDFIHPTILEVSKELRNFALIVILLRAGLGLRRKELNEVGIPAFKMSIIPGIMEGTAIIVFSHYILGYSVVEAGILGFIIAAVSPAVVVPGMLYLKELGFGKNKEIPTLVLAGASLDDVFAITIYSTFLSMYLSDTVNLMRQILSVPVSIFLGIVLGIIIGILMIQLYKRVHIRDTHKILILLSVSILFNAFESIQWINTLLGIMAIGFILLEVIPEVANRLSIKMNKVWVFAEILLFVLIGSEVNIGLALQGGLVGMALIGTGLVFRSIGVVLSLAGSRLNRSEKLFCVFAYLPKATVQAAIGAVPLAMGVAHGEEILAFAVLSIVLTAPVGAAAIRLSAPKLLKKTEI